MKLRFFALMILVLVCSGLLAQTGLYNTVRSKVSFFSTAPLEDISAVNAAATSGINPATNEITVSIPIKDFDFPDELMEEHFNDDYLESAKFPAATFKGKINNAVDWKRLGKIEVAADGVLTVHGVAQRRTLTGSLIVGNNGVQLDSKFKIKLTDHGIKIPKLVFQKIAEVIDVTCHFVYDNK
jgi:polyisoprenoid-binding protein YceI